jgi:hypothetical protein
MSDDLIKRAIISRVHFRWVPETDTLQIFGVDVIPLRVEYSHFEIRDAPFTIEFGKAGSPIGFDETGPAEDEPKTFNIDKEQDEKEEGTEAAR